jgi:periodic tryptophan protein 2
MHQPLSLVVAALASGVFVVYELPTLLHPAQIASKDDVLFNPAMMNPTVHIQGLTMVHALSVSTSAITSLAMNRSGEWLGLASAALGQLLVWEWRSETHILKQQGHLSNALGVSFPPSGKMIASGGADGAVKLWSVQSGFCTATFGEHRAAVTSVVFSPRNDVLISASLDGTVRAWDTKRYRCFRVMTAPAPARQFTCVAIDSSGDLVAAGCQDSFEIVVWSLQTGTMLEILSGHSSVVSCLAFHETFGILASCSWDGSLRLWNLYSHGGNTSVHIPLGKQALSLAWKSSSKEKYLAVSSADGTLSIWDVESEEILCSIDARRDASGGRLSESRTVAPSGGFFSTIAFSDDSRFLLGAGESPYVCFYYVHDDGSSIRLLKRYSLTQNESLDGVLKKLSNKMLSESGISVDQLDTMNTRLDPALPSATGKSALITGHGKTLTVKDVFEKRQKKLIMRTMCVRFGPGSRQWAAVTAEGILVFSKDAMYSRTLDTAFDPTDLGIDITPEHASRCSLSGDHLSALLIALRLQERELVSTVIDRVPVDQVAALVPKIPAQMLVSFLLFWSWRLKRTVYIEFDMIWCKNALVSLADAKRLQPSNTVLNSEHCASALRALLVVMEDHMSRLGKVCDQNTNVLGFLCGL